MCKGALNVNFNNFSMFHPEKKVLELHLDKNSILVWLNMY